MRATTAAVALVGLVAACGVAGAPAPSPTEGMAGNGPGAALAGARSLWDEAGPDSYRFQFEDDCGECDPSLRLPREVTVVDGEASRPDQPTVESLFELIGRAIDEGRTVKVEYHPELGYPSDIAIDMQARAYDGGTHLMVRGLEAVDGQ